MPGMITVAPFTATAAGFASRAGPSRWGGVCVGWSGGGRWKRRRGFCRQGLFALFKPLARSVEPLQRVAEQLGAMDQPVPPPRPVRHWLRPPGSLQEQQFREQCSRCGECVRVCPSYCIKIDYSGDKGEGAPYIEPDESACVMCTPLSCMHNCPSGALLPIVADFI